MVRLSPKPSRLAASRRVCQKSVISGTATIPIEDLVHDLSMGLWRSRGALRALARRKAWEPSIDDCRRIAERHVEQLKRHGVPHVTRSVARAHGVGSEQPVDAPASMPIWAPQPSREG
jgi:hypothetical protein